MTDTLPRTARKSPAPRPARRGSVVVTGATGAVGAAALGLLTSLSLLLGAWVTEPNSSGSAAALLRAGAQLWVLAHRTPVWVPGGRLVLAPLGLTLLLLTFLARAAGSAVRRTSGGRGEAVAAALAVVPPYALLVTLVAGLSRSGSVRPSPLAALLAALTLASVAAAAGLIRARGWAALTESLPAAVQAVGPATAAAVATLLATGALLTAGALATSAATATDLSRTVAGGAPTAFALLLVQLALVPNAIVWGASFGIGTGFAVGVGTAVAPTGVQLSAVPALPLLAALPDSGAAPALSLLALLGALAAGPIAGVVLARRLATTPARAAGWMIVVGLITGLAVGALSWVSGGAAPGRLAELGPEPWLAAAAAAEWVMLTGAPAAWWCARRRSGQIS